MRKPRRDGELVPQYEVHCPTCETPYLGISTDRADAINVLRREGWRQLGQEKLWHCPVCAAQPST